MTFKVSLNFKGRRPKTKDLLLTLKGTRNFGSTSPSIFKLGETAGRSFSDSCFESFGIAT